MKFRCLFSPLCLQGMLASPTPRDGGGRRTGPHPRLRTADIPIGGATGSSVALKAKNPLKAASQWTLVHWTWPLWTFRETLRGSGRSQWMERCTDAQMDAVDRFLFKFFLQIFNNNKLVTLFQLPPQYNNVNKFT